MFYNNNILDMLVAEISIILFMNFIEMFSRKVQEDQISVKIKKL